MKKQNTDTDLYLVLFNSFQLRFLRRNKPKNKYVFLINGEIVWVEYTHKIENSRPDKFNIFMKLA